ncbi:hypothetical protein E8K88_02520 [Lampropedia aestuarii]|uniref:Uncharacterized protein n=1 Tax=Lampropedia aestuarii TaxID=2562762 RepID=A0A4S5C133_9BURK|nr:hypothetical protein [Lampropedia aestuarii]THJ36158.1 hypothetical protein E8K88_02520 [Lampropedia aestuarii]
MLNVSKRLAGAMLESLAADHYEVTPEGIVFPRESVRVSGHFVLDAADGTRHVSRNLRMKEGLLHDLNVAYGTTPKPAGYFIALFSGNTAPAFNWAASSFSTVASEIVSQTEGYTLTTRIPWTPKANAADDTHIDNFGNEVEVTFATESVVNVTGAALLTASAKGATTGVLLSASLYPAPQSFQNGGTFRVGYRTELTQ